jgi:hypothetical protein
MTDSLLPDIIPEGGIVPAGETAPAQYPQGAEDIVPEGDTPRKRGGQRGNTNAFKHGFYSHTFTRPENKRLDNGILGQLDDEEALLHVLVARTAEAMGSREMAYDEYVVALRAVSLAVGRIESIHRSRKAIYDSQTVLEKVWEELKYLPPEED